VSATPSCTRRSQGAAGRGDGGRGEEGRRRGADQPKAEAKKDGKTDEKKEENKPHPGGIEGHGRFSRTASTSTTTATRRASGRTRTASRPDRGAGDLAARHQRQDAPALSALDEKGTHVGKLTGKLIDDGKVTPLVIAAPTDFSDSPWARSTSPSSSRRSRGGGVVSIELDETTFR